MKQSTSPLRLSSGFVRSGFSLLELLSVIAVISLLSALLVPAVSSLTSASRTRSAGEILAAHLKAASVRAMATNQDVWLGLVDDDNGLLIITYDGEPDARPATRPERIEHVNLLEISSLGNLGVDFSQGTDLLDVSSAEKSVHLPGGLGVQTVNRWLIFNPRGEMVSKSDGSLLKLLFIGLGSKQAKGPQATVLKVSGLTGQSAVAYP